MADGTGHEVRSRRDGPGPSTDPSPWPDGDPQPRLIHAVGVGIPALNEEACVDACVMSVLASAKRIELPVVVVVAADRCTDGTAGQAQAAIDRFIDRGRVRGVVLSGDHGGAGGARAAAIDAALSLLPATPVRSWLASTDADTTVPEDWLEAQLHWAEQGADGVAGLVDVDWDERPPWLAASYAASIVPDGTGYGHRHVHGANLGLRAHRWLQVGGCGPALVGEDHELWRRLRAVGAQLHGIDDVRVRTSGRMVARAPLGFSGYLAGLRPIEAFAADGEPCRTA